MASDIWLRTILIVRKETCRHRAYCYRLTANVLLYAPSHRQDNTYHSLCYTSRGALAGTRNSSMGPPHEGSIRWPIAPWANALTTELLPAPRWCCEVLTFRSRGRLCLVGDDLRVEHIAIEVSVHDSLKLLLRRTQHLLVVRLDVQLVVAHFELRAASVGNEPIARIGCFRSLTAGGSQLP